MSTLIKPVFDNIQRGGNLSLVPSSLVKPQVPIISAEDLSLDRTYVKVKDYLSGLNSQAYTLSRELGPFKFFYDSPTDLRVPVPIPPYAVPVPPRAVPVLIGAFVEAVRLLMSFGTMPNETARKILSLILALIDLFQGQWKNAILSFAGVFGQYPLIVGILGKLALNAFSLISPELQDKFLNDIFKSTKSMTIGLFLWCFSTFAPDFVRALARKQFDSIKAMVTDANEKIRALEASMQKSVGPAGLQIKFNEIPEGSVPSFDDIQNLQTIATQPEIMCSKEFQDIVEPLKAAPPARLVLELFNIPTEPVLLQVECGSMAGKPVDSTLEKLITPEISVAPLPQLAPRLKMKGGTRGRRIPKKTRKLHVHF
jgi:hypothetical protein